MFENHFQDFKKILAKNPEYGALIWNINSIIDFVGWLSNDPERIKPKIVIFLTRKCINATAFQKSLSTRRETIQITSFNIKTRNGHRFPIHSSLDWIRRYPFVPYWISDGQYSLSACSFTSPEFSPSSAKQIVISDRMMSIGRKSYARSSVLPSLFARSTRDVKSQTVYISTHCLTCSHNHKNLFEWCKMLNPLSLGFFLWKYMGA